MVLPGSSALSSTSGITTNEYPDMLDYHTSGYVAQEKLKALAHPELSLPFSTAPDNTEYPDMLDYHTSGYIAQERLKAMVKAPEPLLLSIPGNVSKSSASSESRDYRGMS
jgi:hypothetical protein